MNVFLFQLNFYYFRISFFLLLFSVLRAPSLFRKILGLLSYFPLFVSPSSQDLSLSESPRRNNAIIVPSKVLLSSSVFPLILFRLYEILLYRKKTILSHSNLTYLLTYLLHGAGRYLRSWLSLTLSKNILSIWNPKVHYRVQKARHWTLFLSSRIQFAPSNPISIRSSLILSSHLRLGLPTGSFLCASQPKPCKHLSLP